MVNQSSPCLQHNQERIYCKYVHLFVPQHMAQVPIHRQERANPSQAEKEQIAGGRIFVRQEKEEVSGSTRGQANLPLVLQPHPGKVRLGGDLVFCILRSPPCPVESANKTGSQESSVCISSCSHGNQWRGNSELEGGVCFGESGRREGTEERGRKLDGD